MLYTLHNDIPPNSENINEYINLAKFAIFII